MNRLLPAVCVLLCLFSAASADAFFLDGDGPMLHRDPLCDRLALTDQPLRTVDFSSWDEVNDAPEGYPTCSQCVGLYPAFVADAQPPRSYYYNPDGGTMLHTDANCPSVGEAYRPLNKIINAVDAREYTLCPVCAAQRPNDGAFSLACCFEPLKEQATLLQGVWTLPSQTAISADEAYRIARDYVQTLPNVKPDFADGLFTIGVTHYDVGMPSHPKETYKALVTTVLRSPVGVVCVDALTGEVYAAWGDFR